MGFVLLSDRHQPHISRSLQLLSALPSAWERTKNEVYLNYNVGAVQWGRGSSPSTQAPSQSCVLPGLCADTESLLPLLLSQRRTIFTYSQCFLFSWDKHSQPQMSPAQPTYTQGLR